MPKVSVTSKAVATILVILTISTIGGIITMVILFTDQISTMNPTPRPTLQSTTTALPPLMRLPKDVIPLNYRLILQPHFYTRIIEEANVTSPNQTMLFTGNSTVDFHCVKATKTIYLKSKDLTISHKMLRNTDLDEEITIFNMIHHEDSSDFLEFQLDEALEEGGNYSLFLSFQGDITNNIDALFLNRYDEGKPAYEGDTSTERFLVATTLEPTAARRVFPCFDEPDMKAVFRVTIVHRPGTVALSNGQKSDSKIVDNWQYTSFYPTPKMSSYLFAFAVSEFKPVPSPHERVDIQTFASPEDTAAGRTQYAASITGKILSFYEKYFDMTYQHGQLHQIALPDLSLSAMENWGLITYRYGGLLYEEGVSSVLHKEAIAILIAHELAHQWFGNLVTMKWWNDIWLNEGFATYMSYIAVDHVEPSFTMRDVYSFDDLHSAFEDDGLDSSHPLSSPEGDIQTTMDIYPLFSTITYSKGAAVLRMLAGLMGETTFNKGVKRYLSDFKFKNAEQSDLWRSMQKAVDEDAGVIDIATVMDTWTKQSGYPLITINTNNGEISQKHFLFNDSSESSLWWHVPIRVMSATSDSTLVMLTTNQPEIKSELISKDEEWILANVNTTGYYRVNYNLENWERLMTQLETDPERIPLMNRGQLIDDAFSLARAKIVDVTLALNSTRFLFNEKAYLPWESAVRNLQYIIPMFDRSPVYGLMQAYLRNQVKVLYNYYSNYTDNAQVPADHTAQHNQKLAVQTACSNGLPECLEMASKIFAVWMSNGTNFIHPSLRAVIYCHAVAAGGDKEWLFAWNKFQSIRDTSDKDSLSFALSCTTKTWLLTRYLEYTLDPDKIRPVDVASTIVSIAENVAGNALAWNFIRAHWSYVSQRDAPRLIRGVTKKFSTQFEVEELERFKRDYELDSASVAVEQAIEQTRVNIEFVKEHKDVLLEWFESEAVL
ncbi:uncharacterized protein V6R79_014788 [Siganus canaliculatus]